MRWPHDHRARLSAPRPRSKFATEPVSKRLCKKQQMQWSKRGALLLLQTRVKTLNYELNAVFQRWYPAMPLEEVAAAA
jgi:hypothetical protein